MKKIILFILVGIFLLTGCSVKKELSVNDFISKIGNEGFLTDNYTDHVEDKNIKSLYVAKNGKYEFEFHEYKDESSAKKAFSGNKKAFKKLKKSKNIEKNVSTNNYEKYSLESSDQYNIVVRNGKTLIYASINLQYKKEFNKILKNIGY